MVEGAFVFYITRQACPAEKQARRRRRMCLPIAHCTHNPIRAQGARLWCIACLMWSSHHTKTMGGHSQGP